MRLVRDYPFVSGLLILLLVSTLLGCSKLPVSKGNGEPVKLINQRGTTNRPWKSVAEFLKRDDTDSQQYTTERGSAYFAEMLHNRGEYEGIRTALAVAEFEDGGTHVLNAFDTLDYGIVFVDCTGWPAFDGPTPAAVDTGYYSSPFRLPSHESWDKVAHVEKGHPIGFVSVDMEDNLTSIGGTVGVLNVANTEQLDDGWYDRAVRRRQFWQEHWDEFLTMVDDYKLRPRPTTAIERQELGDQIDRNARALLQLWVDKYRGLNWNDTEGVVVNVKLYW